MLYVCGIYLVLSGGSKVLCKVRFKERLCRM